MLVRNTKYERSFLVFFPPPRPNSCRKTKEDKPGMGKNGEKWEKNITALIYKTCSSSLYCNTFFKKKKGEGER